jgi:hypothetical protein
LTGIGFHSLDSVGLATSVNYEIPSSRIIILVPFISRGKILSALYRMNNVEIASGRLQSGFARPELKGVRAATSEPNFTPLSVHRPLSDMR